MKFFDLRQLEDNSFLETDLCIVGSGPAGLSIAKEFLGTKIDVLVLESGGLEDELDTQTLYDIESIGDHRIVEQEYLRRRIFGGSSHIWTGRCAPFDEIDFQARDWIPDSGWPFSLQELDSYFERAGVNLGLGPNIYDEKLWQIFKVSPPTPSIDGKLLKSKFWQFSKSPSLPKEPMRFGRDFIFNASNVRVLLHANVTHINTNEQGTCFKSVEVSTLEKKNACIQAKALVLCCGGIENARLLLASNRCWSNGVGNQNNMVGAFLMDHTLCILGHFDKHQANKVRNRFGFYWLDSKQGRNTYLHGLSLSKEVQCQEKLLKCDAFIETFEPSPDDPWKAIMRLKESASAPSVDSRIYQDAWTIFTNFWEIGQGLYRRQVKHRPQLEKVNRVELHCMLEQLPDSESRVTLSDNKKDLLGMPLSKINWKISDLERQSALRLTQLICQEFERIGLPKPNLAEWLNEEKDWESNFEEKAHPTGTTRISLNPKEGVVDSNCQVHGVNGLFISGSSVFPTSGTSNPTLMIIAMALRLADWLKENYFKD